MKNQNINKILLAILDKDLDKIARKINFKTRDSKLNPHDFLWFCCLSNHNLCTNTLEELCNSLFFHKNIKITSGKTSESQFSKYIYKNLNINSLVLKDLEYFSLEDFSTIDGKGAFFISRLRAGIRLFTLNPNPQFKKNGIIIEKSRYLVTTAGELIQNLEIGESKEFEFLLGSHKKKHHIELF